MWQRPSLHGRGQASGPHWYPLRKQRHHGLSPQPLMLRLPRLVLRLVLLRHRVKSLHARLPSLRINLRLHRPPEGGGYPTC